MQRRAFLASTATAVTGAIAGCTGDDSDGDGGGSNVILSGSTSVTDSWETELEADTPLIFEVTLDNGLGVNAAVNRADNADNVVSINMESEETRTKEFTVPETMEYWIGMSVAAEETGDGDAEFRILEA